MKKLLPLIGAGVGSLVGFGLLFAWLFGGGLTTADKLDTAMRQLDEGRWDRAGKIARNLEAAESIDPETDAAWNYVQGVSKLQSIGEDLDSPRNRRTLIDATDHLIKANDAGFPMGYRGKGKFYLGWCYFNTYRFQEVTEVLKDAEQLWPQRRSEAFRINVESNVRKVPADYIEAERLLSKWSAIPGMSINERSQIAIARAHYAYAKSNFKECEKHLQDVDVTSDQLHASKIWRGRWRIDEAAELPPGDARRAELLDEAMEIVRGVMLSPNAPTKLRRQSQFLIGRVLRLQDRLQEALATFSIVRQANPQTAEAITACLEESEILLADGKLDEAVKICHLLLTNIEDLNLYNGYWLSVGELRTRLLEIGRTLSRDREYDHVVLLASHIALAFPPSDSVRLKADALLRWGDQYRFKQDNAPSDELEQLREAAREKYIQAAEQFELLSRLELRSTEYPEILWRAANAYQSAGDLESANRVLKQYLIYEERPKRPRGYLAVANNYMNLAQWPRAISQLEECMADYPGHAILYDVRLLAAKANYELGDTNKAIELLEENLFDHSLAPKSDVWRDSMFQLGLLRFNSGKRALLESQALGDEPDERDEKLAGFEKAQREFDKALEGLGHASTRYQGEQRFYEARYLMASAKQQSARAYTLQAEKNDAIIEAARRSLLSKRREVLGDALEQFREIRSLANGEPELFDSQDAFLQIQRNCLFGEADVLFDLGRWEEASDAYRNLAGRFMNKPESLEALVRLAECHRKLGKPEEAKKTINQAEQILSRIPPEMDSQFVSLTRSDREGWEKTLGWMKQWD